MFFKVFEKNVFHKYYNTFNLTLIVSYSKKVTIESYNKTAKAYAARVEGMSLERQVNSFLSYLSKGSLVLDLGCGSGRDAKNFTEKGYSVIGVDLSDKLLEIARENAPQAEFKLMDIADLNFPDGYFDGVWAAGSLLHLPKGEVPGVIGKVYDLLKPEGVFYISVKEGAGEVLKPDERYGYVEKFWSFFRAGEMEKSLERFNFTVLESAIDKPNNNYVTNPWIDILCRK